MEKQKIPQFPRPPARIDPEEEDEALDAVCISSSRHNYKAEHMAAASMVTTAPWSTETDISGLKFKSLYTILDRMLKELPADKALDLTVQLINLAHAELKKHRSIKCSE